MLTLNDGRSELWQWDTGRTLAVDADCSQAHFSNKVFGRSIDVDVIGGVAIIPDILLQTDKDLNVWAFVGTAENGYTKISKTFKVNRRNKPADYVFTPPEQTSLEEIKEKIDYLESIQDPDAIKNAVEDYLKQNPVEAPVQSVNGRTGEVELTAEDVGAITKETDPTVPGWAKQPQKPTYTADEVGAVSQADLQEATNEALAQAKASGEFDGANGADGGYYTPAVTQRTENTMQVVFTPSNTTMPAVDGTEITLPDGPRGATGKTAYQYAVEGGYTGTEEAFSAKLAQAMPTTLPNPNALTFTGAVAGTYDGSEAVTVEIPSGGDISGSESAISVSDVIAETQNMWDVPAGKKLVIVPVGGNAKVDSTNQIGSYFTIYEGDPLIIENFGGVYSVEFTRGSTDHIIIVKTVVSDICQVTLTKTTVTSYKVVIMDV